MNILTTGATGALGSELVPLLLEQGHTIIALSRNPPKSYHPKLTFIKGDITKPDLGAPYLSTQIDAFLHLAANVSLHDKDLDLVNCEGTANVVHFCEEHRIPKLFHTSTIYVCGDFKGGFRESDLDVSQSFRNPYEESKFRAEEIVRNSRLNVTIFRPGILAGRCSDGYAPQFEGFYRPLRALVLAHRLAEKRLGLPHRELLERRLHLPRLYLPIRIYGSPGSRPPITPVDWAASAMAKIIDCSFHTSGDTYHILPALPLTVSDIIEGAKESLSVRGLNVAKGHTRNPLDIFYNYAIRDFLPYFGEQPVFLTSVGHTCPSVDKGYIIKIISYWRDHNGQEHGAQAAESVPRAWRPG